MSTHVIQMSHPCGKSHVVNQGKDVRNSEVQQRQQGLQHVQEPSDHTGAAAIIILL